MCIYNIGDYMLVIVLFLWSNSFQNTSSYLQLKKKKISTDDQWKKYTETN